MLMTADAAPPIVPRSIAVRLLRCPRCGWRQASEFALRHSRVEAMALHQPEARVWRHLPCRTLVYETLQRRVECGR